MLGRLIPRDDQFFELFDQLATHLASSAQMLDTLFGDVSNVVFSCGWIVDDAAAAATGDAAHPADGAPGSDDHRRVLVYYASSDTRIHVASTSVALLLDYARNGGTVVVQYGQEEMAQPGLMPFPVTYSRPADRVTVEGAPVKVLDPSSPLLASPNRITSSTC